MHPSGLLDLTAPLTYVIDLRVITVKEWPDNSAEQNFQHLNKKWGPGVTINPNMWGGIDTYNKVKHLKIIL